VLAHRGAFEMPVLSLFAFNPVAISVPPTDAALAGAALDVVVPRDAPICSAKVPELSSDPALREIALETIDGQMLDSGDVQLRAAALLIAARTRRVDERARIERLARLAAGSQDPIVYAIALEGCKGESVADAGACELLGRSQWARLDGDNALPWLELAAEARQQQAFDAEAEAMQRAALARHLDGHASLLPLLVDRALGDRAAPRQRRLALSAAWSAQAGWDLSHANQALVYCGADAVADRERRPTCEALAANLASRGASVADLGAGLAIGRNLGWSSERLDAVQREQDASGEAGKLQAIGFDPGCAH